MIIIVINSKQYLNAIIQTSRVRIGRYSGRRVVSFDIWNIVLGSGSKQNSQECKEITNVEYKFRLLNN